MIGVVFGFRRGLLESLEWLSTVLWLMKLFVSTLLLRCIGVARIGREREVGERGGGTRIGGFR